MWKHIKFFFLGLVSIVLFPIAAFIFLVMIMPVLIIRSCGESFYYIFKERGYK